jgi:hypothetical protein
LFQRCSEPTATHLIAIGYGVGSAPEFGNCSSCWRVYRREMLEQFGFLPKQEGTRVLAPSSSPRPRPPNMPFFLNLFEIIGNSRIPCELKKFLGYNFRHSSLSLSLSLVKFRNVRTAAVAQPQSSNPRYRGVCLWICHGMLATLPHGWGGFPYSQKSKVFCYPIMQAFSFSWSKMVPRAWLSFWI